MSDLKSLSRRNFLSRGGKSLALLAAANVGVYVIGSAFKNLDGSLVAGAKCVPGGGKLGLCWHSCGGGKIQCGEWNCYGSTWVCEGALGPCGGACY